MTPSQLLLVREILVISILLIMNKVHNLKIIKEMIMVNLLVKDKPNQVLYILMEPILGMQVQKNLENYQFSH
jgi:hypothetical protein